ncbi:hypothetical protein BD779DRAFT_1539044 [Infundibulicybe gibba]|nr:hypothetical protein BD779DRAFT_1539044 [Infundibulicybe gibba]
MVFLHICPHYHGTSRCPPNHAKQHILAAPRPKYPTRTNAIETNRLSVGLHDGVAGVLRSSVQSIPPATLVKWRLVIVILYILITGERVATIRPLTDN